MKIRTLAAMTILLANGCASKSSDNVVSIPTSSTEGGIVLGALAELGLPRGACGMVLWTLEQDRPAPIFRYLSGKTAEIVVGGKPVALNRSETRGAQAFGVYEDQTFTSATGLKVAVDVSFTVGFDGGTYLERGLIVVELPDGWRTVSPSAGLAGCRSN